MMSGSEIIDYKAKFLQIFGKHDYNKHPYLVEIYNLYSEDKITMLDAFLRLLKDSESWPSVDSFDLTAFKFKLLCDFHGEEDNDFKNHPEQVNEILQTFINEFTNKLQDELDIELKKIIDIIDSMSPEKFFEVIKKVSSVRSEYNESSPFEPTHTELDILIAIPYFTYLAGKGIKSAIRSSQHTSSKAEIKEDRLDIFSAIYQYLTAVGSQTLHSYKFILILTIAGFKPSFDSHQKRINFIVPKLETELSAFLVRSLHRFHSDSWPAWITQSLIAKMSEIKKERTMRFLETIDGCVLNFNVTNIDLIAAIKKLQKEKNDESTESFNFFSRIKNYSRSGTLDKILSKLEASQITALQALYDVLIDNVGSTGPHSLKFQLLIALIPKLKSENEIISKEKSEETINRFISKIKERMNNPNEPNVVEKDSNSNLGISQSSELLDFSSSPKI